MKTIKEMTEIMLAFDRGEQIQILDKRGIWEDIRQPSWNWAGCDYRVKEKGYVPFDSSLEFLVAQMDHGEIIRRKIDGFYFIRLLTRIKM